MELDKFIVKAEELKKVNYDSPKVDLWQEAVESYLKKTFGDKRTEIFKYAQYPTQMAFDEHHAQTMYLERMDKSIEFLEELKTEEISSESAPAPSLKNLHPVIIEKCSILFTRESYPEAVEKGFKVVRDKLRELTGYETGSEAFGKGGLFILGAASQNTELDFNNGVKFLTMAIDCFRNEKAHTSDGNIAESEKALEYLSISSLALRFLENFEIRKK